MWVRAELKQRAKQNLKRYYWSAVVVCCLFFVLQYATGVNGNSAPNPGGSNEEVEGYIGDNDISYDAEYDAEYDTLPMLKEFAKRYFYSESGAGMFTTVVTSTILFLSLIHI